MGKWINDKYYDYPHIIIKAAHNNTNKDISINRKIHTDNNRLYIKYDSSSWYVEKVIIDGRDAGYYKSIEYRQYHGK